jgi:hypothetical protein
MKMYARIVPDPNPSTLLIEWDTWRMGITYVSAYERSKYSFLDKSFPLQKRIYINDEVFWIQPDRSIYRLGITAGECGRVRWPILGCDKDGFIRYTEEDRLVFHPISDMEKIFVYG